MKLPATTLRGALLAINLIAPTRVAAQTTARQATATLLVAPGEEDAVELLSAELSFSGYRAVTKIDRGRDPWAIFEKGESDVLVSLGSGSNSAQIWAHDPSRNVYTKLISGEPGVIALRAAEYLRTLEFGWAKIPKPESDPALARANITPIVREKKKQLVPHLGTKVQSERLSSSSEGNKRTARATTSNVKRDGSVSEKKAKEPATPASSPEPPKTRVWKLGIGPAFQFSPSKLSPGTHLEGSLSWQFARVAELEATVAGPLSKMTVETPEGTAYVQTAWAGVYAHARMRTRFLSLFAGAGLAATRLVLDGETERVEISTRKFTRISGLALGSVKLETAPLKRFTAQIGYRSGTASPSQRVSVLSEEVAVWGSWVHLINLKVMRSF